MLIHVTLGTGDADVHRVGLRPHRRLRPHQRRLHDLTDPSVSAPERGDSRKVTIGVARNTRADDRYRSMDMLPWSHTFAGRIDELVIDSELLRGNPLGDPHERPLWVYVPPGYDDEDRRYPSVYVLQGYTGMLWRCGATARRSASRIPRVADEQIAAGEIRRASVYVDAWTASAARSSSTHPAPAATTATSATRSSRSSTRATARWLRRSTGRGRQVERRLRRVHHADAASRPVRRPRQPRRRLALRVLLHPRVRQGRCSLRDHYDGSYEQFWEDFRSTSADEPATRRPPW